MSSLFFSSLVDCYFFAILIIFFYYFPCSFVANCLEYLYEFVIFFVAS